MYHNIPLTLRNYSKIIEHNKMLQENLQLMHDSPNFCLECSVVIPKEKINQLSFFLIQNVFLTVVIDLKTF